MLVELVNSHLMSSWRVAVLVPASVVAAQVTAAPCSLLEAASSSSRDPAASVTTRPPTVQRRSGEAESHTSRTVSPWIS